ERESGSRATTRNASTGTRSGGTAMPADDKLNNPLSERFNEALVLAATLHREQARKGTQIPYVSHLLSVAGLVIEHGGNEDQAIAALLHDAGEDQGIEKADEIR